MQKKNTPLRNIRKARGISLAELSKMCGISIGSIGNYETGTRGMSQHFLQKIADALQISVEEISESQPPLHDSEESTLCRYPADCDLVRELAEMRNGLATLSTQVNTLTQLLGASLRSSIEAPEKKAG